MGQRLDRKDVVEREYFEEIEITDPLSGKKFIQKVKITRYKTLSVDKKSITEELEENTIGVPLDGTLTEDEGLDHGRSE